MVVALLPAATGNGSERGWPETRDAMAIIVPGADQGGDDGTTLPGPGVVAAASALALAAAGRRRR